MRRLLCIILATAALAAFAAGCSSDAKKPTEDSIIAMEVMDLVENLRTAYVAKNFSSMARFSTNEAYRTIAGALRSFDSVELAFTPKWVEINRDGDAVDMLVAWEGKWVTGEETQDRDGSVLFSFEGKPLKLKEIKRLSPFNQP